jgi:catechol 2,3-dioxygenase-like lactoylglutathione lyase family enzyme
MDTQTASRAAAITPSGLRGIHHLALNTTDMVATIDFYTRVVGLPLVHALRVPPGVGIGPGNRGNPPWENLRHYFFDMGGDSLLAFFELPADEVATADRNAAGGMQHLSFATSPEQGELMQQRLRTRGIPFLGPIDVGAGTMSIYIMDPSNIRLEVSWQPKDGGMPRVVEGWTQTQAEILRELTTLDASRDWSEVIAHLPA